MSAYILSIGCIILKRFRKQPLPHRRWSLGKFGMAINLAAMAFLLPVFVFAFFPLIASVDEKSMNWSVVMYVGLIGLASAYYVFWGRKYFVAPVALVRRE